MKNKDYNQKVQLDCSKDAVKFLNQLIKKPISGVEIFLLKSQGSNGISDSLRFFEKSKIEYEPSCSIKYWDRKDILPVSDVNDFMDEYISVIFKEDFIIKDQNVIIIDDFQLFYEYNLIWEYLLDIITDKELDLLILLGVNEKRCYDLQLLSDIELKHCKQVITISNPSQNDTKKLAESYSINVEHLNEILKGCRCDLKEIINQIKSITSNN